MKIIEVENLKVSYSNHTAIENVSFSVEAGEYIALVGENGSLIIGQSARFMMDEEGAAAAAVTQTKNPTSTGRSSAPKVVSFIANSPFIYTITETGSGLILFMGTFSGM